MSVSDFIRRAMVLATIIGDDETPTAQQQVDALADMNDMLAAWRTEGIECGAPYAATDTLAVPDSFLRALRFNLAVEIAPSYGVGSQNVMVGRRSIAAIADDELDRLRDAIIDVPEANFEAGLTSFGRVQGLRLP